MALVAVVLTITLALSSWALAYRSTGALLRIEGWSNAGSSRSSGSSAAALAEGLRLLHLAAPAGEGGRCRFCPDTGQQEYLLHFTRLAEQPQTWSLAVERAGPNDPTSPCREVYPALP